MYNSLVIELRGTEGCVQKLTVVFDMYVYFLPSNFRRISIPNKKFFVSYRVYNVESKDVEGTPNLVLLTLVSCTNKDLSSTNRLIGVLSAPH